jgi:hypothetical protein
MSIRYSNNINHKIFESVFPTELKAALREFEKKCEQLILFKEKERVILDLIQLKKAEESKKNIDKPDIYFVRNELVKRRNDSAPLHNSIHHANGYIITEFEIIRRHFLHYIRECELKIEEKYSRACSAANLIEDDLATLRRDTPNLGFTTIRLKEEDTEKVHLQFNTAYSQYLSTIEEAKDSVAIGLKLNNFQSYNLIEKLQHFKRLKLPIPQFLDEILPQQWDSSIWHPQMFAEKRRIQAELRQKQDLIAQNEELTKLHLAYQEKYKTLPTTQDANGPLQGDEKKDSTGQTS